MKRINYLPILLLTLSMCTKSNPSLLTFTDDPHSFAKPSEAVVEHLDWDANLNFDTKTINAVARLSISSSETATKLILDTRDLTIQRVTTGPAHEEMETSYELGQPIEHLGQALSIAIRPETKFVNVYYSTDPKAAALQWLEPVQTADKNHPFLFTQSQAILARSWIPIQDSPGIRFTYTANVQVPEGLLALMSAENPKHSNAEGLYTFKMEQPIPAYLLALAVGDIRFAELGDRSGVYAEPSVVEAAAYEFAELEEMISVAEALYGPYRWERYDLIVLPPSFPFGGMENPRLTFATPTILAGDRSLVSLVAHELAHSWSGNLVTNATWNDFWLNEGFTVYFEQRIMEAMEGRDYSEMLASLSQSDLKAQVDEMMKSAPEDTRLKLELEGRNPDDGVTTIAYDKGYFFLRWLEERAGRENFDAFLRMYFKRHAFQTMTTERFIAYLNKNLIAKYGVKATEAELEAWIYEEGLPLTLPEVESERFAEVDKLAKAWKNGQTIKPENWSSHEWLRFVRQIPKGTDARELDRLDQQFGFTKTGNSEVLTVWLTKAIHARYNEAYPRLEEFLVNTGRRKFLVPLFRAMLESKQEKMAKEIYAKARPNYHFVSTNTLDEMLKY